MNQKFTFKESARRACENLNINAFRKNVSAKAKVPKAGVLSIIIDGETKGGHLSSKTVSLIAFHQTPSSSAALAERYGVHRKTVYRCKAKERVLPPPKVFCVCVLFPRP